MFNFKQPTTDSRSIGIRMAVVAIIAGLFSVWSIVNSPQVSAQEPPAPLTGGLTVTQPVTGSGPSTGADLTPETNQSISPSGEQGDPPATETESTTDQTSTVADSAGSEVSSDSSDSTNTTDNPKSYTRFEVHQQAIGNLSGTLSVNGDKFGQSVPYSASAGESFSVSSLFPERTGEYRLELTILNETDPILWIEGELQKVGDGDYRHQFMNGDANPEFLTLVPDDPGLIIALGSVRARLNSCVNFYTPLESDFEIGVDKDGNGLIDQTELFVRSLENESTACIETPESNLPLTSRYTAQVVTPQGTVVAQNEGLYDFLNKSAIESRKLARPDLIREFQVKWIRTPLATSVSVLNNALRPPPEQVTAVPQIEEITRDIIQNDSDPTATYPDLEATETTPSIGDSGNQVTNPLNLIVNNWLWFAAGTGLILAMILIYQTMKSTEGINHRWRR